MIPFVGRRVELRALCRLNEKQMYLPLFIYGPEGCGKTTLLREFTTSFNNYFSKGFALYVNAESESWRPQEVFTVPKIYSELIHEIALSLAEFLNVPLSQIAGRIAGRYVSAMLEKIYLRRLRGRVDRLFIAIDEIVKSIGLPSIEGYAKSMYNEINFRNEQHPFFGVILNYIAATSEGESLELLGRHSYISIMIVWNMLRRDFEELYYRVKEYFPGSAPPFEDIWKLLGGNPRRLIELAQKYQWNVEYFLKDLVNTYRDSIMRIRKKGFTDMLKAIIEDPDNVFRDEVSIDIRDYLVGMNLLINKSLPTLTREEIPQDLEIAVGKYYAWQTPIYREAVKKILME